MRWYAVAGTDPGEGSPGPYIVAEVVAEMAGDGTFTARESTVLSDDRNLLSRPELLATEEGRRALAAWESGDDAAYERASQRFLAKVLAEDERAPGMAETA
jgi:hypothetical protein